MRPKNYFTSFAVRGAGMLHIDSNFSGSSSNPFSDTKWPRYWMCFLKKLHFSRFIFKPNFCNLVKISSKCCKCSSSDLLKMIMSSRYPIAKLLHPMRTLSISNWKYTGAWLRPKGVSLNCHFPIGTTNADFALDSLVSPML